MRHKRSTPNRGYRVADQIQRDLAELLRELMQVWWERVGSTRASGIFKLVLAEACNFPDLTRFYVDEVVLPVRRVLAGAIERGIASGEFRRLNPDEVVHALIAPAQYLVLHQHSIGACGFHEMDLDVRSFLDTQLDLFLHGLAADPREGAR